MTLAHVGSIVLSAVVALIVGLVWYSPFGFGKQWATWKRLEFGSKEEAKQYQKSMGKSYVGGFLALLLTSWIFWMMIGLMGITEVSGTLLLATILWGGFVLPFTFSQALFDKKHLGLWAIDTGCAYASLFAMAVVFGLLR
jgi:hypothetical protein